MSTKSADVLSPASLGSPTTRNPLSAFLHSHKARELVEDRKVQDVLTLRTTTSVEQAVKALSKAGVLSAPVLDENDECTGFIDMLDIARFIVAAAPDQQSLDRDTLGSLKIAGRAIALVPIKSVVDASGKDPLVTVFEESPASVLAEHFSGGIHRAILFNAKKQVAQLVSQSDVNRFLAKNINRGELKALGQKTMAQLGYINENIDTVGADETVLAALNKMVKAKVSALAVVDAQGMLVGNFSASDLRGLYQESFPHFLDSVKDFLKRHHAGSLAPVVGRPDTSLTDTCRDMAERKLHHMWVVDEKKPVGIISLTDVMKIICNAQLD